MEVRAHESRQFLKQKLFELWQNDHRYFAAARHANTELTAERRRMIDLIPLGERVLDVACGTAENGRAICGGTYYVGVDISPVGLRMASDYVNLNLALVQADCECLPFASNIFKAVISTYSLEHFTDPRSVLSEMWRVCSPGGRIMLVGPSWDHPFTRPPSVEDSSMSAVAYVARQIVKNLRLLMSKDFTSFEIVRNPTILSQPYHMDNDAVHVVFARDVVHFFSSKGGRVVVVRERSPQPNNYSLSKEPAKKLSRFIKNLLLRTEIFRYWLPGLFVVIEKAGSAPMSGVGLSTKE